MRDVSKELLEPDDMPQNLEESSHDRSQYSTKGEPNSEYNIPGSKHDFDQKTGEIIISSSSLGRQSNQDQKLDNVDQSEDLDKGIEFGFRPKESQDSSTDKQDEWF